MRLRSAARRADDSHPRAGSGSAAIREQRRSHGRRQRDHARAVPGRPTGPIAGRPPVLRGHQLASRPSSPRDPAATPTRPLPHESLVQPSNGPISRASIGFAVVADAFLTPTRSGGTRWVDGSEVDSLSPRRRDRSRTSARRGPSLASGVLRRLGKQPRRVDWLDVESMNVRGAHGHSTKVRSFSRSPSASVDPNAP